MKIPPLGLLKYWSNYYSFKNHLPLQDAKIPIKDQLIASNDAILYKEPESKIMSRSGDECVVSLCDQWYLGNLTPNFRFLSICFKNIIKTKQSRNLEPERTLVFIIDYTSSPLGLFLEFERMSVLRILIQFDQV